MPTETTEYPIEAALKPECDALRADLLAIEKRVRATVVTMKTLAARSQAGTGAQPHPECFANAMLAVRHIEDARMRLGKVLQHARDGVSVFDKG